MNERPLPNGRHQVANVRKWVDAVGHQRTVWFEVIDAELFVFAGVVRRITAGEADRYAFLTCAPNTVVGTIHSKALPVILHSTAITRG